MKRRALVLLSAAALLAAAVPGAWNAGAAAPVPTATPPPVLHQGVVTRQDVASQPGSETDTVVEPDVAVSPVNRNIAVAAAHDSRFPDGGAVSISVANTTNGGATWRHRPVPGITTATGGRYQRASDPVVAFAADGTGYLSVLLFDETSCPTAVAVLRTDDGGQSWSAPSYAHRSATCNYSDDKNFITVDNSATSPHFGRVYQFWTPFISRSDGSYRGSPQAVRWSDDGGLTWSRTSYVTPLNHGAQNSQPMIMADGTVVDTYYDYGAGNMAPDVIVGGGSVGGSVGGSAEADRSQARARAVPLAAPVDAEGTIYASTSTDGGRTWSGENEVADNAGGYASGVRCCLFSATIDPTTQILYAAWLGGVNSTDPVYTSQSTDGENWSSPVRVSQGDVRGIQRVNVGVAALDGTVYIGYGTRTKPGDHGGYVQQQLSVSTDRGRSFGKPESVGPVSVLRYAAFADGYFPGDYIGMDVTRGRLYMVWAVSSAPPASSSSKYHQVIDGATFGI